MNNTEVREKISQGESLHCEFKLAATQLPASFFETVCAFLNTDGGTIFLGISDCREVTGVSDEAVLRVCSDIASLSNNPQKLEPPFLLFPQILELDERKVIVVQVPFADSSVERRDLSTQPGRRL